jgi:hypothetical protein
LGSQTSTQIESVSVPSLLVIALVVSFCEEDSFCILVERVHDVSEDSFSSCFCHHHA